MVDRNGYATVYEYDANGNRTAVRYANGIIVTYDYDLLNRLTCQKVLDIDGEVMVQYTYALGLAGERLSASELDRTVEYTYDNLYRLTGETITEGEKVTTYTYAYDSVGNRILKNVDGQETVYSYNALNQLVSEGDITYEYDLNGNLVRVIGTGRSALYEYNSENKLVKATVQSGNNVVVETYTYDYAGNRTSKTTSTNGQVEYVKYLNDTNSALTNVLCEIDENGTEKCVYTIDADLISQERDGKLSYYLYDGHGSVTALANESGVVTDTYTYDAFGNLLDSTGNTENCYLYCGEQFDEATGLYYLRARYMDTSTGRFISQDSYAGDINDPVSLHKYLYANANPVMYSDPSGYSADLMSVTTAAAGMAIIASGLLVMNSIGILRNLTDALIELTDKIVEIEVQITEVLIAIRIGICASVAYAQRVLNDVAEGMIPGNINILYTCLFGYVAWHVILSIELRGNKYGNDQEEHHIVAQTALRAHPARLRLRLSGIKIDDGCNKVLVKKVMHKFLHITEYYIWVNEEIKDAFSTAFWQNFDGTLDFTKCKSNVTKRLLYIKQLILSLNSFVP
ncbi:MAG: AHH domain-containing protein [Oscillospiraceae bacterium]|nr:AHH domain-containing protein [Oscillospiraceae bacterium]